MNLSEKFIIFMVNAGSPSSKTYSGSSFPGKPVFLTRTFLQEGMI